MVSSYLSLVDRRYGDDLDEEGREFLEFAVDGAERMREMIDALLTYSRVETRGDPFEPVDLDEVFADVRRDYRVRIQETDADVSAESLPTVHGDDDQLRQVLGNLLSNALEYSGGDPPDVEVTAARVGRDAADSASTGPGGREGPSGREGPTGSDGGRWRIGVHDEGIGIDPDHTEAIFQVFQRLHTHDEHPGTGIGLALCERILERHGGEIWVESEPGEGSSFYFTLPSVPGDNP